MNFSLIDTKKLYFDGFMFLILSSNKKHVTVLSYEKLINLALNYFITSMLVRPLAARIKL